jgi:hypothetical protein
VIRADLVDRLEVEWYGTGRPPVHITERNSELHETLQRLVLLVDGVAREAGD